MSLSLTLQLLVALQERIPLLEREMEKCTEQLKGLCTDSIVRASIEGRLLALRTSHRLATDALERWK